MTKWKENDFNNELEQETKFMEYMDVQIQHIQLQRGRDFADLIEVAANNWYLKQQWYRAVGEFMKRIESDTP